MTIENENYQHTGIIERATLEFLRSEIFFFTLKITEIETPIY